MAESKQGKDEIAVLAAALENMSQTCRRQAEQIGEMEAALADKERMIRWQEQKIQWQERLLKERWPGVSGEAAMLQQELDKVVNSTAYKFGTFFSKKAARLKRMIKK